MNPLISVVITAYNQAWVIRETLETVLGQSYDPFEVILVDDGSTDDTQSVVSEFGSKIKYIRHSKNQGSDAVTRNTGIRAARGDYVAFLDGDDLWEPDKLQTQVDAALRYPEAGIIAVDGVQFDHLSKEILNNSLLSDRLQESIPMGAVVKINIYEELIRVCCLETPSQIMVPRAIVNEMGGYDSSILGANDYDFLVRIAHKYDVVIIRKNLVRYRKLAEGISGPLNQQYSRFLHSHMAIMKKQLMAGEKQYHGQIKDRIRCELLRASSRAYEDGKSGKRVWASKFLLGLPKYNRAMTLLIGRYLIGLWLPLWVRRCRNYMVFKE